jgi:hypothetical protein
MKALTVVRARIVGCGDLLGVLNPETNQLEFYPVLGAYNVSANSKLVNIRIEVATKEETLTYHKRDRVTICFPCSPPASLRVCECCQSTDQEPRWEVSKIPPYDRIVGCTQCMPNGFHPEARR